MASLTSSPESSTSPTPTSDYDNSTIGIGNSPISGHHGVNSTNGVNGANGINGAHGVNGANGINGIHGVNGANGINGAHGVNGTNGTNGVGTHSINGHHGVNGSNGVNGTNGVNGAKEANSVNGAHGIDGVNGANDTNGTNGVNVSSPNGDEDIPIAIVGVSCRLPGDVSSPEEFWELLSRARCGWSEIPKERFNPATFYHPNPEKAGCYNPIGGHFLSEDLGLFDAPFFNVTEKEAISMDPQQRLLLECTFEAMENGGATKEKFVGKDVGVYIGGSFADYELRNVRDTDTVPMFQATGCAPALMSNRLSYYFDFRGPSYTIDTACSSSLSALHLACQSLRNRETTTAIVGGCHLNILPDYFITMSMSRLFNDTGKSYSFDHRGKSGFGRGEGVGVVMLKPLDQALKDNDHIRAVIRASGSNQDGKTQGITSPSGDAQVELMRSVYEKAGLNPLDTGFVEAHGTGTKVGDPIEASALHQVFGACRTAKTPIYIGSVKSNIGHLEGASGIISVIKAAMMLEKGMILPNVNFEKGNESIPFSEWNLKVPTTVRPWPRNKRYISVNNFGFGGTNAHVVLEKAPMAQGFGLNGISGGGNIGQISNQRKLYVLSANDKQSVEKQKAAIGIYLEQRPEVFQNALLGNLAYTLGQRRSTLPWKAAISASGSMELIPKLASADAMAVRAVNEPRIGFVFTGQGAQSARMGFELLDAYPVFNETMRAADQCLINLGADFSLIDELSKDTEFSKVAEAHISQPACTAVQLALVALLKSWNILPSATVGHSSGEIGAAYAAGILGLEDCMAIAYFRGQSVVSLKEKHSNVKGTMLAVGAGAEEMQPMINELTDGKAVVACINSPSSVTISGDESAIDELQPLVEKRLIFNRRLRVDVAYHSHHMDLVAEEYRQNIRNIRPKNTSDVEFYSSLLGRYCKSTQLDADYWVQNLTKPVGFSNGLSAMCHPFEKETKPRVDMLIEVGPHAALEGPIKQILKSVGGSALKTQYASMLIRKKDAVETAMDVAATMFQKGVNLDFKAINFPYSNTKVPSLLTDLPHYPWNHTVKYWHESRISLQHNHRTSPRRDLLGSMAEYSNELEPTWRNILRTDDMPWLRHHKMQSMTVYPMAGYMAQAIEAAADLAEKRGVIFNKFELREITVSRPLIISEGSVVETNLTMRPYTEGTRISADDWDEFRVYSWAKDRGWIEHCRGLIAAINITTNVIDGKERIEAVTAALAQRMSLIKTVAQTPVEPSAFYQELESKGAGYGSTFQSMLNCYRSGEHAVADIIIPDTAADMPMHYETPHIVHPAFLDQFIQIVWPVLGAGNGGLNTLYMPSFVQNMTLNVGLTTTAGDGLKVFGTGFPTPESPKATKFDLFATKLESGNEALVTMDGLIMTPIFDGSGDIDADQTRELCYKLSWEPLVKDKDTESNVEDHATNGNSVKIPSTTTELQVAIVCESSQRTLAEMVANAITTLIMTQPEIVSMTELVATDKVCVVLSELASPFLANMTGEQFKFLQDAMASAAGIIWVTSGAYIDSTNPDANMVVGMARSIRSETLLKFSTIDISAQASGATISNVLAQIYELNFVADKPADGYDFEFSERNGQLFIPRVIEDGETNKYVHQETKSAAPDMQPFDQPGRPLKIIIGTPGALDTLHFVDDEAVGTPLPDYEVEIEIKATSMNFKDIMIAMGQLSSTYLGVECAGIISGIGKKVEGLSVGDRVSAMSEGAYATYTRCLGTSVQKIADDISFEKAATVPVIFCTAYYGLFDLARLQEGERVLIHAAAGGVGQAAIQLAKMKGAEIFATVGSIAKKNHIMSEYGIQEDHIFYSRDISFAKAIKCATNGEGVDVVLNSLAGNALRETWDCLSHFGRFIEIGKRDIVRNTRLEMARFEFNAMFASVDLTVVAAERPKIMKRLLKDVFSLIDRNVVKPISPITIFPIADVETAFRALQGGKVMGKVVIIPGETDKVRAVPAKTPSNLLSADATYILIGGTGGLGRSMARWMISKGARNLVLVSRSGNSGGKVAELIEEATVQSGAKIIVRSCDVANKSDVEELITSGCSQLPPIRGVIHGAMVLHDVLFEKMTHSQWDAVVKPKVAGAWNFHNALSSTPLDFFVTISSTAGAVGNRGQAAYAAANVFLNAFCQFRNTLGLPATSIDLTAVSDVGYLAENESRKAEVTENLGSETINEKEVLALLSAAIRGRLTTECNSHTITGLKIAPDTVDKLFWASDRKFAHLLTAARAAQITTASTANISLGSALKTALTFADATNVVTEGLVTKVSAVLMVPIEEIDVAAAIVKYGLDSLVAIEIRNWIIREFEASLQVLELLTSTSITALAETIIVKSKLCSHEKGVAQ